MARDYVTISSNGRLTVKVNYVSIMVELQARVLHKGRNLAMALLVLLWGVTIAFFEEKLCNIC